LMLRFHLKQGFRETELPGASVVSCVVSQFRRIRVQTRPCRTPASEMAGCY